MELRTYQTECIDTIEAQPPGAYLAQMATGLGKTVTFANLPRHGYGCQYPGTEFR